MDPTIDLDAYFSRIGYSGDRAPTLKTLQGIVVRHTEAIPFENLNPLLRWPVHLDTASLEEKTGARRPWRLLFRAQPAAHRGA